MFHVLFLLFASFIIDKSYSTISCLDNSGDAVDWFIIYKLPIIDDASSSSSADMRRGLAYLYIDSNHNEKWMLNSEININNSNCAVCRTIDQLYALKSNPNIYHLLYNDDPINARADPNRAHSKGVQLFDATSGYWITHSIPRYPPIDAPYNYPNSATRNGQSIMCISMQTSQLKDISLQLKIYQLNIYSSSLPTSMAQHFPDLADVISRKKIRHWSKYSNVANIVSNDGMLFLADLIDIYSDLIAPHLQSSLLVETWLNGAGDLPSNCTLPYKTFNLRSVTPNGIEFRSSKDHSKWSISINASDAYVCIGDINRQKSQLKRGGGSICMQNANVWKAFNDSVGLVEQCSLI